jgi:hypothetical protein
MMLGFIYFNPLTSKVFWGWRAVGAVMHLEPLEIKYYYMLIYPSTILNILFATDVIMTYLSKTVPFSFSL